MSGEISKTYDPASIEGPIYQLWLDEGCLGADPAAPGESYCIVIPPPNVTGALHLGHAINNTLQDVLIRVHRMRGFNTLWVPGIDHAGIATQAVVEKQLKEKEGLDRHQLGREKLVERIWQWKQQYGQRILEQLKRLGCSCDWNRSRFTLDEMYARAVRETFFKLFKDGLVYRGKRLVNWDVHLQTSISDDEIYHETVKTSLWHIRYPIVDTQAPHVHAGLQEAQQRPTHVTIATTRPETMLGDTAVAVHSQDPRWNWAIGKSAELPLTGRRIPIIADDILVDPKFGTGVVKVTPAHDPNDYAAWQRLGGKIEILNILNPEGTINENGGKYAGMKRDAARKKVVEDLTALGLLEKEEPYETQVGHSDRSKTPIEPYLSDQWFVKMAPLAEPALQVVRDGIIKFFPERHAQQYLSWLGEKRDWPISRQLWWGHRIPVWSKLRPKSHLLEGIRIEGIVNVAPPAAGEVIFEQYRVKTKSRTANLAIRREIRDSDFIDYVSIEHGFDALERQLEHDGYAQDPDVLDTWFSSALWPHSTLGWPDDTADLRKWYPTSALLTAREIVTLWVARMVMMGIYNMKERLGTDKAAIPFRHVVINTTILDGKGERMSKSKGNGVDPVEIIETHGADALRFTLTHMATETQDVRLPVKKDAQGRNTSDKFDLGSRFCNKIWQVAHFFVIANLEKVTPEKVDQNKWSLADRWIVSRFNNTVKEADTALADYRFDQYAKICYDFFYGDFCDWYVEAAKPALKISATAGQTANVLAAVLDGSLRLMHPMIPFITETIWQRLNDARPQRSLPGQLDCPPSKRLILASWPISSEAAIDPRAESDFSRVHQTSTALRNLQNEHNKVDINFQLIPNADTTRASIALIQSFTGATISTVSEPPVGLAAQTTPSGQFFFPKVDPSVEQHRVAKRRDELEQQITTLRARLSNEAYTAKAPPHLVQQTRDQLADAQAEMAKLG